MNFKRFGLVSLLFVVVVGTQACSTGVVPPSTIVIVAKTSGETETKTNGKFTAWGRDRVYFIDTKLKGFTEKMQILCKDDVNMMVDVKWTGSFDVSSSKKIEMIKSKVPSVPIETGDITGYQLSLDRFYKTAMADIVRANSRKVVSPYNTDSIVSSRDDIEKAIKKAVVDRFVALGFPVKSTDVLLSNLDYDPEITKQRKAIKKAQLEDKRKAAEAKATVAQALRDEDIARAQGKALIERKRAEAKGNEILTKSITPAILAMRQWEVLETMAKGTNNEMIIIPYEAVNSKTLTEAVNRRSLRGSK